MIDVVLRQRGRFSAWAILLCLCCTLPYWCIFSLPPISDTYLQIHLGRKFFDIATVPDLAADALYRCRALSIWLTGLTDHLFGSDIAVFRLQSLLLHAANVGLVMLLGRFQPFRYWLTVPAAILWGFNERHHEAVIWYAALPEQLVFTFVISGLLFWLSWWETGKTSAYCLSILSFLLALLSKESAVVLCALLFIPVLFDFSHLRRAVIASLPFVSISALYFFFNMAARDNHLHWNDGTFRLGWHFIPVMWNSSLRLLTVWGFAALVFLIATRNAFNNRYLALALLWIPATLAPYSFVAYQPRVPSRHVYIASIGVALLLAIAIEQLSARKRLIVGLFSMYILFNTCYVWFFKYGQFLERGLVTEKLLEDTRQISERFGRRPVQVSCFPLAPEIAQLAIQQRLEIPAEFVSVQVRETPACGPVTVEAVLD